MEKTMITLGGQEYTVVELKRKANSAWRQKLQAEFAEVAKLVGDLSNVEIKNGEQLQTAVTQITQKVSGSLDTVMEMVFDYSPELSAHRTQIEDDVFDSEILQAFIAILGLAYPFGSVLSTISGLVALGQQAGPIGANSASPSTESTTAS